MRFHFRPYETCRSGPVLPSESVPESDAHVDRVQVERHGLELLLENVVQAPCQVDFRVRSRVLDARLRQAPPTAGMPPERSVS